MVTDSEQLEEIDKCLTDFENCPRLKWRKDADNHLFKDCKELYAIARRFEASAKREAEMRTDLSRGYNELVSEIARSEARVKELEEELLNVKSREEGWKIAKTMAEEDLARQRRVMDGWQKDHNGCVGKMHSAYLEERIKIVEKERDAALAEVRMHIDTRDGEIAKAKKQASEAHAEAEALRALPERLKAAVSGWKPARMFNAEWLIREIDEILSPRREGETCRVACTNAVGGFHLETGQVERCPKCKPPSPSPEPFPKDPCAKHPDHVVADGKRLYLLSLTEALRLSRGAWGVCEEPPIHAPGTEKASSGEGQAKGATAQPNTPAPAAVKPAESGQLPCGCYTEWVERGDGHSPACKKPPAPCPGTAGSIVIDGSYFQGFTIKPQVGHCPSCQSKGG